MQRGALFVAQGAEIPCFVQNDGVLRERAILIPAKIHTDFKDERRDVIEQGVAGKNLLRADGYDVDEPIEPARGKAILLGTHPRRNQIAEVRCDHCNLRTAEYTERSSRRKRNRTNLQTGKSIGLPQHKRAVWC